MKKKEKIWWSASTLVDRNVFKGPSVFIWWHAKKVLWRRDRLPTPVFLGFPCGSAGKESAWNVGDLGLIPGLGRSPGEGKVYPLQYSGLENSMDPWGPKELDMTERLWLSHDVLIPVFAIFFPAVLISFETSLFSLSWRLLLSLHLC